MADQSFQVWVPAEPLRKSDDGAGHARPVSGWATTDAEDLQKEVIVQDGVDMGPLMDWGVIDWDHQSSKGPEFIIGEPDAIELRPLSGGGSGFFLKGHLFTDHPKADAAWGILERHARGESRIQLGFSVDGAVLQRSGRFIKKAIVKAVALTHQPVNRQALAWATVAKSLAGSDSAPVAMGCQECRAAVLAHLVEHRGVAATEAAQRVIDWHRRGAF